MHSPTPMPPARPPPHTMKSSALLVELVSLERDDRDPYDFGWPEQRAARLEAVAAEVDRRFPVPPPP